MASSKSQVEVAITDKDWSRLESIISDARNRDRQDILQEALTISCEKNNLEIVERLIALGADYTRNFGPRRRPPLILAVELDHEAIVRCLLEKGSFQDEVWVKKKDALLRRGLLGAKSEAVGKLLIDHVGDINYQDKKEKNRTLLMTIRDPMIVKLLIKKGVKLEMKDDEGNTALMWTMQQHDNPAVAKVLIEQGANINTTDHQGRSLLTTAIWKNRVEMVQILIDKRVNVHARDKRGRNALHHLAADKARKYAYKSDNASVKDEKQKEADTQILRMLLDTRINTSETDNTGRTALHWAASLGSSGVLDLLLQTRRFIVDAPDQRAKTPLHWAASIGDLKSVEVLLQEEDIAVNAESDGDWTVLHIACACKADPSDVVQKLIDNGASIQKKTRTGLTPLHIAAEAGNVSIVRLLLKQTDVKRTARDGFGNTPLLSGAKTRHKNRSDIIKLFAPWNNLHTLSPDAIDAATKFNATVVDFTGKKSKVSEKVQNKSQAPPAPEKTEAKDHANASAERPQSTKRTPSGLEKSQSKGQAAPAAAKPKPPKIRTPSVFDLLYEKHDSDDNKPKMKTSVDDKTPESDAFRWIHFPTNNVSWCLDLFTKHFVEEGGGDWNSFRALERSFNHQHRGREAHARYMTPLCQTVMRPWGDEEVGWLDEQDAEEPPSRQNTTVVEDLNDLPLPRGSMEVPHVSFGPVETISGKAESMSPTEPVSMHFPNETPSESLKRPPMPSRSSFSSRRSSFRPSTHMPAKEDLRRSEDTGPVTDFYVFMPYLHFETYDQRQEMRNSYSRILHTSSGGTDPRRASTWRTVGSELTPSQTLEGMTENHAPEISKDHTLFRAFLDTSEESLHIRRTLDQSFYHHINTKERDKTQVIHRFQTKFDPNNKPKVLMVDQLWLYVIGRKLVVTCFPQRWKQPKKDPLNVLDSILAIVNQPNREPVHNVYELAMIITGRCYGAFDRHGIGSDEMQFLDMFEGWIGAAMDDEVKLFKRFLKDSAKASKWLQTAKLRDFKRIKDTSEKVEGAEKEDRFTILQSPGTNRSDFVKNLLDIGSETELLGDIKDIQDELDMLALIFSHQAQVLQGIREAIELIKKHEHLPPMLHQLIRKAFDDHRRTIQHPQTEIRRMHGQADRMYDSIRDLLDLKQKHANAIEARFAREQQYDTSQQGRTLMIFTIFTVVFLPLTFVAALFAIDIAELPHINGVQVLPAGYVAKYTFGLGAAISLLFVFLAVYYSYILDGIRRIGDWWKDRGNSTSQPGQSAANTNRQAPQAAQQEFQPSRVDMQPEVRFRETRFRQEDLEKGGTNGYIYG